MITFIAIVILLISILQFMFIWAEWFILKSIETSLQVINHINKEKLNERKSIDNSNKKLSKK